MGIQRTSVRCVLIPSVRDGKERLLMLRTHCSKGEMEGGFLDA